MSLLAESVPGEIIKVAEGRDTEGKLFTVTYFDEKASKEVTGVWREVTIPDEKRFVSASGYASKHCLTTYIDRIE